MNLLKKREIQLTSKAKRTMSMKWHVTMKCRTLPSLCCMAAGLSPAWPVKKIFILKFYCWKKKLKFILWLFVFWLFLLKFYFIARVMWIAYLQGRGCWRWRPAPMTGCTGRRPCPLRALFEWPTSWASSLPSPSGCWCLRVVNRNWWSGQKVGSRLANTLPLCYIFNGEKYLFLPSTDLHTNTISWLTAEGEFIEIPSHRREATNFRAATMAKVALNQQLSASKSAARAAQMKTMADVLKCWNAHKQWAPGSQPLSTGNGQQLVPVISIDLECQCPRQSGGSASDQEGAFKLFRPESEPSSSKAHPTTRIKFKSLHSAGFKWISL